MGLAITCRIGQSCLLYSELGMRPRSRCVAGEAEAQVLLVRLVLAALLRQPGPKLVAGAQRAAETGPAGLRSVLPCHSPVCHHCLQSHCQYTDDPSGTRCESKVLK